MVDVLAYLGIFNGVDMGIMGLLVLLDQNSWLDITQSVLILSFSGCLVTLCKLAEPP